MHPAVVLIETHVQPPVQAVFDTPVVSRCSRKAFSAVGWTGWNCRKVVARFTGYLVTYLPRALGDPDALEAWPSLLFIFPGNPVGQFNQPVVAGLYTAMPFVSGAHRPRSKLGVLVLSCVLDKELDIVEQITVTVLQSQDENTALLRNLFGNCLLTVQCIGSYDAIFDV